MAKAVSKKKPDFLHSREGYLIIAIAALVATYSIGSRAIDTGSLIQYFLTLLFLGIGINRIVKIFKK